jgi:hypothetical protein
MPLESSADESGLTFPRKLIPNRKSCYCDRLTQLLDQQSRGIHLWPHTRAAVNLAQRYGISLPSAYRHLRRGTTPASDRKVGRDGKMRPLTYKRRDVPEDFSI